MTVPAGKTEMLVSTKPYTGRDKPEWCRFVREKEGDASPYPLIFELPADVGGGHGQCKREEVQAWR